MHGSSLCVLDSDDNGLRYFLVLSGAGVGHLPNVLVIGRRLVQNEGPVDVAEPGVGLDLLRAQRPPQPLLRVLRVIERSEHVVMNGN